MRTAVASALEFVVGKGERRGETRRAKRVEPCCFLPLVLIVEVSHHKGNVSYVVK